MGDWKKWLNYIGCGAVLLILFAFTAYFAGFHKGEDRGRFTGGGSGLCGNIPEPYRTIFTKAGDRWDVQPAFIAAIFLAGEHHAGSYTFNPQTKWPNANGPWASSPAGAQGPFQFIPGTWAGHKQDGNGDGDTDVQNLWDSAFGAANLLAMNGAGGNTTDLDKFRDAASRYNSGRPWSRGQGIPETAKYVPRVIGAFQYFYCAPSFAGAGKWIWPVGGRISSKFQTPSRPNHTGVDIAASRGTIIKASQGGTVTVSNKPNNNTCGAYVKLKHEEGFESIYCHMIENSPMVSVGEQVRQGQDIGKVDNTGRSRGNHLHFGIQKDGRWVDPLNYLPAK